MVKLQVTGATTLVDHNILPRGTGHQHPLVAFAVNREIEVVRTVDAQNQIPVVHRPRRQNHIASETASERLRSF